jgi:hypothetical protein
MCIDRVNCANSLVDMTRADSLVDMPQTEHINTHKQVYARRTDALDGMPGSREYKHTHIHTYI